MIKHKRRTLFYCSSSLSQDPKSLPMLVPFSGFSIGTPRGVTLKFNNSRAYSALAQNPQEVKLRH